MVIEKKGLYMIVFRLTIPGDQGRGPAMLTFRDPEIFQMSGTMPLWLMVDTDARQRRGM